MNQGTHDALTTQAVRERPAEVARNFELEANDKDLQLTSKIVVDNKNVAERKPQRERKGKTSTAGSANEQQQRWEENRQDTADIKATQLISKIDADGKDQEG